MRALSRSDGTVAVFEYKAMRAGGETVSGTLDADSARRARESLRRHGLFVTEMREVGRRAEALSWRRLLPFAPDARPRVLWMTRELNLLLMTGMPLRDALGSLARSAPRGMRHLLRSLRDEITKGDSLAAALRRHPDWFDGLYVGMIEAGERSGELSAVLGHLADYLESQDAFRRQMQTALLYPKLVAVAAFGVVVFLMSSVVPRFIEVILRRGGELPWPTQVLRGVSGFCAANWLWIVLALAAAWAAWQLLGARSGLAAHWRRLLTRLPLLGPLRQRQAAQQFSVMLGALLRGGVMLPDALGQLAEAIGDPLVKAEAAGMRERVLHGGGLATGEPADSPFPASFADMVAAGQETGSLEQVLRTAARVYAAEIEATTKKVAALVEPAAILLVAGVVAFVVAAILLPVFELSQIR
jgi:general secretion pathway protein F